MLMGAAGVGKTCIIKRWIERRYFGEYIPTKFQKETTEVQVKGKNCKVEILDTAGLSAYWSLRDSFVRTVDGIMLVFSLNDVESFEYLTTLHEQVSRGMREDSTIIIIGNKEDLPEDVRSVNYHLAQETANKLGAEYRETSAMTGFQIDDAFLRLIELCMDKRIAVNDVPTKKTKKGVMAQCKQQ